jgi:hypothetical protein
MSHTNHPLRNQNDDQITDPLDAVLLAEFNSAEQLRPSSGFAHSVMDAIHEEATVPPPIPFPWKLFLPGAIAILCALVALVIWAARGSSAPAAVSNFTLALPSLISTNSMLGWIALALLLTLIAVLSSFRMANGRLR